MDDFEEFKRQETHFLKKVEVQTSGSRLDAGLLTSVLRPVSEARSVKALHQGILSSVKTLNSLDLFKQCAVKILPGTEVDTALVEYQFRLLRWWAIGLDMLHNTEGGRVAASVLLRNLNSRADKSSATLEIKPNTRTLGLSFDYVDQLFRPGKWALGVNYHLRERQLDFNLATKELGGFVSLTTEDHSNAFKLGRDVRINFPLIDRTSINTLREGILTSEKYFLSHEFRVDTRNIAVAPTSGYLIKAGNEFSFGSGNRQHTLDLSGNWFLPLYRNLTLELSSQWQWILPWNFTRSHINDRIRAHYIKGFQSVGERTPPADPTLPGQFYAPGDNLGTSNFFSAEAKLHFHKAPLLHYLGLSPFVYANFLGVGADPGKPIQSLKTLRGSFGLGIEWVTSLGRVEFAYSGKVFSRPGDLPVEFQILFFD